MILDGFPTFGHRPPLAPALKLVLLFLELCSARSLCAGHGEFCPSSFCPMYVHSTLSVYPPYILGDDLIWVLQRARTPLLYPLIAYKFRREKKPSLWPGWLRRWDLDTNMNMNMNTNLEWNDYLDTSRERMYKGMDGRTTGE